MTNNSMTWLRQISHHYRKQLSFLLLLRLMVFASQVVCFWSFAQIMEQFIIAKTSIRNDELLTFTFSATIWLILRHIIVEKQLSLENDVEQELQHQINTELHTQQTALVKQHSSYFWQQIFLNHIPAVAEFISQYQLQKMLSGLMPILVIVAIWPANYFVAIITLLTLPVIPIFMILVGKGAANLQRQHFTALERLGGLFVDRLKAITLISVFAKQRQQVAQLAQASSIVNDRTMKVVGVAFLSTSVLDFFATIAIALVAVFIGFSLLGELSIGPEITLDIGLYLLLLTPLLFSELKTLGRLYHQKAKAESAADNIVTALSLQTALSESKTLSESKALSTKKSVPHIDKTQTANQEAFQAIDWLNYSVSHPAIHAKRLSIHRGDKICLHGSSGAGKTVLLEALMNMRQASHVLSVDAIMLSQQAVVLPGTIRENLTLDSTYTTADDELIDMLQRVELSDWVSQQQHGLQTILGEHPPMSGGEAQRLCLARALLQHPEIIIFDEPTAHLTEQQHQSLVELICQLSADKTVIWASHKPLPETWFTHHWHLQDGELLCR